MPDQLKKVYGIDLGTTYSCIAVVDDTGKAAVIRNSFSESTTPSVVHFESTDNIVVGKPAKMAADMDPDRVVQMVKRDMGSTDYAFVCDGEEYSAHKVSSFILGKLVKDVESETGEKVEDVVITCPAWFGSNQREATAAAGELAKLNVVRIINEPTAAAICYGMHEEGEQTVLVYDLGGGTFDITMIEIKDEEITVICTGGNHFLGGKNWDQAIVNYLAEEFQNETKAGEDMLSDQETLCDLLNRAEDNKKILSTREKATIRVIYEGERVDVEVTREKFNELTRKMLDETIELTRDMLGEAKRKGKEDFDKILLVGGSSRMPQVGERLKEEFPNKECLLYDPDESVAKGAALFGRSIAIGEAIKHRIAEETGTDVENVDLANVDEEVRTKAERDVSNQFTLGSGELEGARKKTTNVTSKTFGVVANNKDGKEKVFNLIRRNDPLPADYTHVFGTDAHGQEIVEIKLMENQSIDRVSEVDDSDELDKAELQLPPGLPAGSPIEVTCTLTEEGRLELSARQPGGKDIRIKVEGLMSAEAIEREKSSGLSFENVEP